MGIFDGGGRGPFQDGDEEAYGPFRALNRLLASGRQLTPQQQARLDALDARMDQFGALNAVGKKPTPIEVKPAGTDIPPAPSAPAPAGAPAGPITWQYGGPQTTRLLTTFGPFSPNSMPRF